MFFISPKSKPSGKSDQKISKVHGHSVYYNDDAKQGIDYLLNDLDLSESRVFFDQAKSKGAANFEDDQEGQYTLDYQNGKYFLIRR